MADKYGDRAPPPKSKVPSSSRLPSSSRATSASMTKGSTKSSQSVIPSQPPPAYQTHAAQPEAMLTALQRDRPKEHFEIREGSNVKYPTEKVPPTKYLTEKQQLHTRYPTGHTLHERTSTKYPYPPQRSQYRQTIYHPQPKKQVLTQYPTHHPQDKTRSPTNHPCPPQEASVVKSSSHAHQSQHHNHHSSRHAHHSSRAHQSSQQQAREPSRYPSAAPTGFKSMAPSNAKSYFVSEEDAKMASRQTRIESLSRVERQQQEEWAQELIRRMGACPEGYTLSLSALLLFLFPRLPSCSH
jgi:hypothetical protein